MVFSGDLLDSEAMILKIEALKLKVGEEEEHKKILINSLLELSKSLDGESRDVLGYIFDETNMLPFAQKKLEKGSWVEKALTIQVLSRLKVETAFDFVSKYTDFKSNHLVREEAQIAAVRLGGANCLTFIDTLETNLTVWQQLKILEELKRLEIPIVPNYKIWLNSNNVSVVCFALKLIGLFGHFEALVHLKDVILRTELPIRKNILKTLSRLQVPFFNDDIIKWLEIPELQLLVIKTLTVVNDNNDDTLEKYLKTDNQDLFFETAKFFKVNNPSRLEECIDAMTLDDMKMRTLAHVNDKRI